MRVRTPQPPSIKRVRARLGWAWQVTATVHRKRRKYQVYEAAWPKGVAEAKAREEAAKWCAEQANLQLATRKIETKLSEDQVRVAEEFYSLLPANVTCEYVRALGHLRLTGSQLTMAQLLFRRMPDLGETALTTRVAQWEAELALQQLPLDQAIERFMASRRVQSAQRLTYHGILRSLSKHVGAQTPVASITKEQMEVFLSRYSHPTTYNKRRGDLGSFFNWTLKHELIRKSPLALVEERDEGTKDSMPETLSADRAAALMHAVESEFPGLVTYCALNLFAACRPSWRVGEAYELVYKYPDRRRAFFRHGALHIPGDIAKPGIPRTVPYAEVPPLAEWIAAYPPGEYDPPKNPERVIQGLRERFQIPHDGLRHTGISMALGMGMDFSRATLIFGVEERIMKTRYANLLSREEATALSQILPRLGRPRDQKSPL
jgi:hypothetical protein